MRDPTFRVFENLEITSHMGVRKRLSYTQRILREAALKIYREVLVECRRSAKEIVGDEWNLRELTELSAEDLWNWDKTDTMGYDRHPFLARDKCAEVERELWFELGEYMWRKHRSVYQYHMKYIHKYIVNPFKIKNCPLCQARL